jgi:hypothetical protein
MAQLVTLPDQRTPTSSISAPNNWMGHDGTIKWTPDSRSHVSKITSSQGGSESGSMDVGVNGSIYASSSGFSARVASKQDQDFRTFHYFGNKGGLSLGHLNPGQTVSGGNQSCWVRDVTGFFCQVNGAPTIDGDYGTDGDSANDSCGRTKHFRVYGIYIDSSKKTHIYEYTKGDKLLREYYTYTEYAPNSWKNFGYKLPKRDAFKVVDQKLMLGGWCVTIVHRKTCGNKQKNMTGRIRYMTPIINSNPEFYSGQESGYPWQIVMPPNTSADTAKGGFDGASAPPMYTK